MNQHHDLIRHFEGCHLKAYLCPAGIPTIGYGHTRTVTLADARQGRMISREAAEALLALDLKPLETLVAPLGLAEHQAGALVSLGFNIGARALQGSSAWRAAAAGDHVKAAASILLWDKARVNGVLTVLPGLTRRRRAEARLYIEGRWMGDHQ